MTRHVKAFWDLEWEMHIAVDVVVSVIIIITNMRVRTMFVC